MPPLTNTDAVPLVAEQLASVVVMVSVGAPEVVRVTDVLPRHELASVTVTE